jgi:hypothetical protein
MAERRFTFSAYPKFALAIDAACIQARLSSSEYCRRAVWAQIEKDGILAEKVSRRNCRGMDMIALDQALLADGIDLASNQELTPEQAQIALGLA